jgi:membrane-bound lytic murein transglycosylase A
VRRALRQAAAALVLAGAAVTACAPAPPPPEPAPDRIALAPAGWDDLPGWADDPVAEALPALSRSCARIARLPEDRPVGPDGAYGRAADWRAACAALAAVPPGDGAALRAALLSGFRPWAARNAAREEGGETGLFTGYYEPLLRGARAPGGRYAVPLHARPPDLVEVELGRFRPAMRGERIAGRVEGGRLVPYADRTAIVGGALAGRELELLWVDDPVDAFFLQIQGSGRVELEDGRSVRVGYAGQNGHPYVAIGRELVARGALAREEVSLQSIRAWLAANPGEADAVMALNPSYVFFREIEGEGPLGAEGLPLEPGRSIAVDPRFVAYGTPVWLDAEDPLDPAARVRRLMVAQDTGGAIRGPVRGDVFWGAGDEAEERAGRMRSRGRWWLLLPAGVAPPGA